MKHLFCNLRLLIPVTYGMLIPFRLLAGVNYEEPPISYSTTQETNSITHLQSRLNAGETKLEFEKPHGYLRSVLRELSIPLSSQVLVFSKTSLQADKISPQKPRAIYFNDEVHIGYVQEGILEIAAADSRLGMVFYTLEQTVDSAPAFQRQNNRCLNCHGAARTRNIPGLLVRSVFPDSKGQPVIAAGSSLSTHVSPLEKRWGGWYVTGRHGNQQHLGNFHLPSAKKPSSIENVAGQNVINLASKIDPSEYLTPHSDIVALMVLENQTDGYNVMTQSRFETLYALHLLAQSGKPETPEYQQALRDAVHKIDSAAESVVSFLLFHKETPLISEIVGTSGFTNDFVKQGEQIVSKPTLREFDLKTRMFKYPCNYLIASKFFRELPKELRTAIYHRLIVALAPDSNYFAVQRLDYEERKLLLSILAGLVPDWPSGIE